MSFPAVVEVMLCEQCQKREAEVCHVVCESETEPSALRQNNLCVLCASVVMGIPETQPSAVISEDLRIVSHEPEGWTIIEVIPRVGAKSAPKWRIRTHFIPQDLRQVGRQFSIYCSAEELRQLEE